MSDEQIYYHAQLLDTDINPTLVSGDGDSPSNDLVLVEEENYLLLTVTEQQYSRMLSALFNGAFTTYPLDFISVIYPLIKAGKMSLCDAILDCIETTPELQQVIAQYSIFSSIAQDATQVQANLDVELVNDPVGCDDDIIFGMTTGLTDLLNTVSEDILEVFIAFSSPSGRIGDMIEAIPVIGEAPIDDLFQFVESFINDLNDSYEGAYTSQIRDDIRCDLFCLASNNDCVLTLEMVRDYFYAKLGGAISISLWNGFMDDIISIAYSGEPAIWAMHLLIIQTIIFGGELVGFDVNRLVRTIQSLYNDPDSDWTGVCDSCNDWEKSWDFTIGSGESDGWQQVTWGDGWESGVGWRSEADGGRQQNYLQNFMPEEGEINFIEFTFSNGGSPTNFNSGGGGDYIVAATWSPTYTEQVRYDADGTAINITLSVYDDVDLTMDRFGLLCNPLSGSDWYVTGCTVRGIGANPYV